VGRTGGTIGSRFGAGPNALNFVRLVLAIEVIAWHAHALRGGHSVPERLEVFGAEIAVDGFFAVSGFLICRSWFRNPSSLRFAAARARRLLPGLWVCLIVTAFVIAPLATHAAGHRELSLRGQLEFVLGNATTWVGVQDIDGGPTGVSHPGAWNGSLWSLSWEVSAYAAIAILGMFALLRCRVVVWLAAVFWLWAFALVASGSWVVDTGHPLWLLPRTGLMFACGALLYLLRDRIPMSRALAGVAVALVVGGVAATPSYRLAAAPAIAYLCLYVGIELGRFSRLVLRHDLSYGVYIYAFPIQQALLLWGFGSIGWAAFTGLSIVCTLPLAAASWFAVERPAQRLRRPVVRDESGSLDRLTPQPLHRPH
jgi:peptidoglycan/LPS O-acetylase OafA/YrhL